MGLFRRGEKFVDVAVEIVSNKRVCMMGYDRTLEGFSRAFEELKMMVRWHNKPFWIVAQGDKYHISAVEPYSKDIAGGTTANLFDVDFNIIKSIAGGGD